MRSPEVRNPGQNIPHEDEIDQSEEMRLYMARKHGLDESASWDTISATDDEDIRKKSASVLGLDDNASWDQIHAAEEGQGDRVSSALLLGLDRDATYADIVAERTRQQRELHRIVAEQMKQNQSPKK